MSCPARRAFSSWGRTVSSKPSTPVPRARPSDMRAAAFRRISSSTGNRLPPRLPKLAERGGMVGGGGPALGIRVALIRVASGFTLLMGRAYATPDPWSQRTAVATRSQVDHQMGRQTPDSSLRAHRRWRRQAGAGAKDDAPSGVAGSACQMRPAGPMDRRTTTLEHHVGGRQSHPGRARRGTGRTIGPDPAQGPLVDPAGRHGDRVPHGHSWSTPPGPSS